MNISLCNIFAHVLPGEHRGVLWGETPLTSRPPESSKKVVYIRTAWYKYYVT